MSIVLDDLTAQLDTLTKAVLSQPLARIGCSRVTIRPLSLRGKAFFQLEYQQHVSSPEALLVDCMVRCDCTAKDAIKLLLKDDNNTYSKNELYAAHLALKERFGA